MRKLIAACVFALLCSGCQDGSGRLSPIGDGRAAGAFQPDRRVSAYWAEFCSRLPDYVEREAVRRDLALRASSEKKERGENPKVDIDSVRENDRRFILPDFSNYTWKMPKLKHPLWLSLWYGRSESWAPLFVRDGDLTRVGQALVLALSHVDDHALDETRYAERLREIEALLSRWKAMHQTLSDRSRLELTPEETVVLSSWLATHGQAADPELLCDWDKTPLKRVSAFCRREGERRQEYLYLGYGLEFMLADAWLSYIEAMKYGNLDKFSPEELKRYATESNPNAIHPKYYDNVLLDRFNAATQSLSQEAEEPEKVFEALIPQHEQYAKLQAVRSRYRQIVEAGGWNGIAPDRMFFGGRAPLVRLLKQRLSAEGYYRGEDDDLFDEGLKSAILSYQKYHQLEETGEVSDVFWRSLNVSAKQRLSEIEVNIRYWHRTVFEKRDRYIYINLPSFNVEVWDKGKEIATHRAVVGNSTRICNTRTKQWEMINATKIMHARMTYLVFNPYWNVPPRIEVDEYHKKIEADPQWLETSGFEYYTPRGGGRVLRQKPGENNALGRVKLIFPNRYNIYLHDTPKQQMFTYAVRAFSHGCIRVENALAFAKTILELDGQWDEAQIERYFKDSGEHPVNLKAPIDVFIDYHTVTVDAEGQPYFLADIYRYIKDEISPPTEMDKSCDPLVDRTSSFRSGEVSDSGP